MCCLVCIPVAVLIVTKPSDKAASASGSSASFNSPPMLRMRHVVHLSQADVVSGSKPNIFVVNSPGEHLKFDCASVLEATEWSNALREAILARRKGVTTQSPPRSPYSNSLFQAIADKDDRLAELLHNGGSHSINVRDKEGFTPLHRCVLAGWVDGVTLLLEHHPDVTIPDANGQSALHLAAMKGDFQILFVFLVRKPGVEKIMDQHGRTCLWNLLQGDSGQRPAAHATPLSSTSYASPSPISALQSDSTPSMSKTGHHRKSLKWPKPGPPNQVASGASAAAASAHGSPSGDDFGASNSEHTDSNDDADVDGVSSHGRSPSQHELRQRTAEHRESWKSLVDCFQQMIQSGIQLDQRVSYQRYITRH
jgi:ankyrin repeat protein